MLHGIWQVWEIRGISNLTTFSRRITISILNSIIPELLEPWWLHISELCPVFLRTFLDHISVILLRLHCTCFTACPGISTYVWRQKLFTTQNTHRRCPIGHQCFSLKHDNKIAYVVFCYLYRVTQKNGNFWKKPTKIEEIKENKIIDRNWTITTCLLRGSNPDYQCLKITSCRWRPPPRMHSFTATTHFKSSHSFVSPCVFCMLCRMRLCRIWIWITVF